MITLLPTKKKKKKKKNRKEHQQQQTESVGHALVQNISCFLAIIIHTLFRFLFAGINKHKEIN